MHPPHLPADPQHRPLELLAFGQQPCGVARSMLEQQSRNVDEERAHQPFPLPPPRRGELVKRDLPLVDGIVRRRAPAAPRPRECLPRQLRILLPGPTGEHRHRPGGAGGGFEALEEPAPHWRRAQGRPCVVPAQVRGQDRGHLLGLLRGGDQLLPQRHHPVPPSRVASREQLSRPDRIGTGSVRGQPHLEALVGSHGRCSNGGLRGHRAGPETHQAMAIRQQLVVAPVRERRARVHDLTGSRGDDEALLHGAVTYPGGPQIPAQGPPAVRRRRRRWLGVCRLPEVLALQVLDRRPRGRVCH